MNHEWIPDRMYSPHEDSSHSNRWVCQICNAELYEWVGIKNKKFRRYYYIFANSTQYDFSYKCKNLKNEKISNTFSAMVNSNSINGKCILNFEE